MRASPAAVGSGTNIPWSWWLQAGFLVVVTTGLMINQGRLISVFYTPVAVALGLLLIRHDQTHYVRFAWWLWFLTPLVRRMVDLQVGWTPISPVMLAPVIVTAIAAVSLLQRLNHLFEKRMLPFALILVGLTYGLIVGAFSDGATPVSALFDFLNWSAPLLFCVFLMRRETTNGDLARSVERVFAAGTLVMGAYGLLQFMRPPSWDAYWMDNAPMGNQGSPEPYQVRVFSTMNSNGVFAHLMMSALLLSANMGGKQALASGLGYVAFALALVRSAWLGWLIGMLYCAWHALKRLRLNLVAAIAVFAVVAWLVSSNVPMAERVNERLGTFSELDEDLSYLTRVDIYTSFGPKALLSLVGQGLGSTGVATKLTTTEGDLGEFGDFDSGLLQVPFVLGWLGGLPFFTGVVLLWRKIFASAPGDKRVEISSRAIVIALAMQLVFTNPFAGASGMAFWTFMGLALAAREEPAEPHE